jgi:hypothetical protein
MKIDFEQFETEELERLATIFEMASTGLSERVVKALARANGTASSWVLLRIETANSAADMRKVIRERGSKAL